MGVIGIFLLVEIIKGFISVFNINVIVGDSI